MLSNRWRRGPVTKRYVTRWAFARPHFRKKKYGGLGVSELRRLKNLEGENAQLKKLVADLSLDKQILRTFLPAGRQESSEAVPKARDGRKYKDRVQYFHQPLLWPCPFGKGHVLLKGPGRGDELLRMRMKEIAVVRVRYGFWRIHILLRREVFMDNHKRMCQVYCEKGLNTKEKPICHAQEGSPWRTMPLV